MIYHPSTFDLLLVCVDCWTLSKRYGIISMRGSHLPQGKVWLLQWKSPVQSRNWLSILKHHAASYTRTHPHAQTHLSSPGTQIRDTRYPLDWAILDSPGTLIVHYPPQH